MNYVCRILIVSIITVASFLCLKTQAFELPYNVEDKTQLFVDRLLVYQANRVCFTQHQGQKHVENPLLMADQPWEGWRVQIYGSVIYDQQEKIYKMWYYAEPGKDTKYFYDGGVTCYATSKDGIHWEKPLVGTLACKNGKPHNAVTYSHLASVIKDMDDPDPTSRYKMICWRQPKKPMGYHTDVSPDGLHWKPFSTSPIAPGADVITGFWDQRRGMYVAFSKKHSVPWRGHRRRLFYTVTSEDFINWSKPVLSWKTDLRDDIGALARIEKIRPLLDQPDDFKQLRTEFYGIGVYTAESCTIGFPWVFTVNNWARWGGHEGTAEIQLAVSHDLVNWERPFRTPVIAMGKHNEWDAAYQVTSARAIRVGDEIRLYYTGANYTHGHPALYRTHYEDGKSTGRKTEVKSSIGLVTWKLDRFVSVDGPKEGGILTTVTVRFTGKQLVINAATKPGGQIVVELLDAAGQPLEAFPFSDPFSGDNLRYVVTFAGKSDVSNLVGRPVTLKFHISNAELYSFAFRP